MEARGPIESSTWIKAFEWTPSTRLGAANLRRVGAEWSDCCCAGRGGARRAAGGRHAGGGQPDEPHHGHICMVGLNGTERLAGEQGQKS